MGKGHIQFMIGILILIFGIYQLYFSITIENTSAQGISLGMGAVFILWGLREIIGSEFVWGENEK